MDQKGWFRILERFGLPTLLAVGLGAAFWYWSDRTAVERRADNDAFRAALEKTWAAQARTTQAVQNLELTIREKCR